MPIMLQPKVRHDYEGHGYQDHGCGYSQGYRQAHVQAHAMNAYDYYGYPGHTPRKDPLGPSGHH